MTVKLNWINRKGHFLKLVNIKVYLYTCNTLYENHPFQHLSHILLFFCLERERMLIFKRSNHYLFCK